jgi:hypothetical protein
MRRKGGAPAEPQVPTGRSSSPFLTSVGFGCAMINQLAERLEAEGHDGGFNGSPVLSEKLWREEGLRYPRADLVRWRGGRLDPAPLEEYVRRSGSLSKHMNGCVEDSMAALAAVGRALSIGNGSDSGGGRKRVVDEVVRGFTHKVQVTWPSDFMPQGWIRQWTQESD